jgi:hypothetical protein
MRHVLKLNPMMGIAHVARMEDAKTTYLKIELEDVEGIVHLQYGLVPGKHEIKKLQKTAIYWALHTYFGEY